VSRPSAWIAAGLSLLGALAIAAVAWRSASEEQLAERRAVLDRLVEEARASTAEAEGRLAAGTWDLYAEVPSGLVERVLREFVGYRQRTRRGNYFAVRTLQTRMREGYAELRVTADFDWRLGLYDGPVEATYYAFARVSPDGGCDLFFRVAEMKTLAAWPLFNRFLEPILTYRMQRSLEIPNLRLPLGMAREASDAAEWRRTLQSGVEVTVPGRPIGIGPRRILPLLDRHRLGVVVERPRTAPAGEPAELSPFGGEDEVRIGVRLDFLSERLAQAVAPQSDFTFAVDRMAKVWSRRTKGGTDLSVDLVNLRGTVDVRDARLGPGESGLLLDANVRALVAGQVEGAVLQIRHGLPLRLESSFREQVPLRIVAQAGGLGLELDLGEMSIPLAVQTRVGATPVRFTTSIGVPAECGRFR